MGLLHIWNRNLKLGASPFKNLKYVNESEISSCSKAPDVGIQNTAFEAQSQQCNPEKDPWSPFREIVKKLFKSVHPNIVTKVEQF